MKTKVVIITASQLMQREIDFFCLDSLADNFEIEYWDCSSFLFPNFRVPQKVLVRPYLRVINDLKVFSVQIGALSHTTVVVVDVFPNKSNYHFYRILCNKFPRHLTAFFSTNMVKADSSEPLQNNSGDNTNAYLRGIKKVLYKPFIVKRLNKFVKYHGKDNYQYHVNKLYEEKISKMSDMTILGCHKCFEKRLNHPDYEKFLTMKDSQRLFSYKYIVFIDEYYPYLQDVANEDPDMDIEKASTLYHKSMNNLFEQVERSTHHEVVIAAHPRSDYNRNNPFNGRKLVYYQTANLIQHAEAVIIHHSNCYSFVSLYDKPVLAVINDGLRMSTFMTNNIIETNNSLCIDVYDADHQQFDATLFKKIDNKIRLDYINTYLTDCTQSKTNVELFSEYFEDFHTHLTCAK